MQLRRGRCTRLVLPVAISILLLPFPSARGQEPSARSNTLRFSNEDQIRELNRLNASQTASADDLINLSRLLADPDDQIAWLLNKIQGFKTASDGRLALALIERTKARISVWETRDTRFDFSRHADELENLELLLFPPEEILDPAKLQRSLQEHKQRGGEFALADAGDAAKFVLLARGADPTLLGLAEDAPATDWDRPRIVVQRLTADATGALPAFRVLLELEQDLQASSRAFADTGNALPGASATFRIAAALLGRAIGVDGADRGKADDDDPNSWRSLADTLQASNLWRWEALARVLHHASSAEPPSPGIQAVATIWSKVLAPGKGGWPNVQNWLDRLAAGEARIANTLPLSSDFRTAARQLRLAHEQDFVRNAGDVETAFRHMQLAKAAEAGFDVNQYETASVDDIKTWFGHGQNDPKPDKLHLYLELLEVRDAGYYGIAIGAANALLGGRGQYMMTLIGPHREPGEVVERALQAVGLVANPQGIMKQGMIVVAPDHILRGMADVEACERRLLPCVARPKYWFVYTPTASALADDSPWTLQQTLRFWHQSALAHGDKTMGILRRGRRSRGRIRVHNSNLPRAARMYAIHLGGDYPRLNSNEAGRTAFLPDLLAEKNPASAKHKPEAAAVIPFVLNSQN